ncbi:MAG: IS66 family insertion sequence element accessory protein TnpB [Cyclobacteriaceae bacterium]|nr:IS66 family insertion sequence element accessory protein TnpB [Cyclobacteriaceae bacterium]
MFSLSNTHQYFLYTGPTDMRKSFDGLAGVVQQHFNRNPLNGEVFVFINKRRDRLKLLHWEPGGFTLYYKRLEKGTLEIPDIQGDTCHISWSTLMLMIEGIGLESVKKRPRFGQ